MTSLKVFSFFLPLFSCLLLKESISSVNVILLKMLKIFSKSSLDFCTAYQQVSTLYTPFTFDIINTYLLKSIISLINIYMMTRYTTSHGCVDLKMRKHSLGFMRINLAFCDGLPSLRILLNLGEMKTGNLSTDLT